MAEAARRGRRPKASRYGAIIHFRVEQDIRDALDELSARRGRTLTEEIRAALVEHLGRAGVSASVDPMPEPMAATVEELRGLATELRELIDTARSRSAGASP